MPVQPALLISEGTTGAHQEHQARARSAIRRCRSAPRPPSAPHPSPAFRFLALQEDHLAGRWGRQTRHRRRCRVAPSGGGCQRAAQEPVEMGGPGGTEVSRGVTHGTGVEERDEPAHWRGPAASDLLKHMIRQPHEGQAPDQVRTQLIASRGRCPTMKWRRGTGVDRRGDAGRGDAPVRRAYRRDAGAIDVSQAPPRRRGTRRTPLP